MTMALLVNKKLLNFRWVDADRVLSFASLPELARISSITSLINRLICKVAAGDVSGPLQKMVQGQAYQLEAAIYDGWTLAGAEHLARGIKW